jgi:hypothetical protein
MKSRAARFIGLGIGAGVWLASPWFLLLVSAEGVYAIVFLAVGPFALLPVTLLGLRRPRLASSIFLLLAVLAVIVSLKWMQTQVPPVTKSDVIGVLVSCIIPGAVPSLLMSWLLRPAKGVSLPVV